MRHQTETDSGGTATAVPPESEGRRRARLVRRQRLSRWDVRLSPYLYISPFFILFALLGLYPLVYTFYLSLFDWNKAYYVRGEFVGLDNFRFLLDNAEFHTSLVNTFSIFLMSSVPQVCIALVVAALLDTGLRGRTFWRMSVLLPFVVAPTAVVLIFGSFFADTYGIINQSLSWLHDDAFSWLPWVEGRAGIPFIQPIQWHVDRWWSHVAIAGMVNWRWTGYNTLIFLAALQAVPRELYESAAIDGAGRIRQFFSVTVPMIRPTLVFVIITSTIGGLQIFTEPQLFDNTPARNGGPSHQYETAALYIYLWAFKYNDYGKASAAACVLFVIILLLVALNFAITRFLMRRSSQ